MFEVSEANLHIKTLELKAYDYMLRFEKELKLTASGGTAYSFLLMASTKCDVALAQTKAEIEAMPNGTETLGIYSNNDMESYRDLIFYVAQVLGCVCQINREGKLELIPYGITPVAEIQCVGKNPKLAAAKSKNDKNITGLLNQIEAGKIVVYNFVNGTVTEDEDTEEAETIPITKEVSFTYTKIGESELTVTYKMNRSWCSSSSANDQRAVTIECASDGADGVSLVCQQVLSGRLAVCKAG